MWRYCSGNSLNELPICTTKIKDQNETFKPSNLCRQRNIFLQTFSLYIEKWAHIATNLMILIRVNNLGIMLYINTYCFSEGQIHNPINYVRDHYFFKRSQYPQLRLVHMEPEEAFEKLQQQELLQKFVEIGKVLLTWAILKNVDMVCTIVICWRLWLSG